MPDSRQLNGRTAIYTDAEEIDASNLQDVLDDVDSKQTQNNSDISYLYDYYRGIQPILQRTKTYNDYVLNKVVENRAKEISDFKTGYFLSAPIQYIDATANDANETIENSDLGKLTRWMRSENKEASDLEIAFWQSVCGTAFRMLNPKDQAPEDETEAPFEIINLDPRYTYVVYSSAPSHKPLLGVTYVEDDQGDKTTYCYTDTATFVIDKDDNVTSGSHQLGRVPIIEYPMGPTRMGDFEPVIPLLDAINTTESNRIDGVEQFIQAILLLKAVDPGADPAAFMEQVKENGLLGIPNSDGDAKYLTLDLDQTSTQTLVDGMYDAVLKIVGMPNPKSGYNTSDTGAAVILRDGWSATEAVATRTETWFRKSERQFLNMAIDFCDITGGLNLLHQDVDIRFPRRNYTNDTSNVDNLIKLLSTDWVTPEQAFEHSNMFPDPHSEFLKAKAWHDQQEQQTVANLMSDETEETDGDTGNNGSSGDTAQTGEQQSRETVSSAY